MTPSLERLNELVRLAEARSRSKKVEADARHAGERLRDTVQQARQAARRMREQRPTRLKELEQADHDEQQLRELVKRLAQFKAAIDPESNPEALIDSARNEIVRARASARAALEEMTQEIDEARRGLRGALDAYMQHRRELDRLCPGPESSERFAAEDRLVWEAETHFPGGVLHALAREVEVTAPIYGTLTRAEQYAQLKVWIGRYRQFQDEGDPAGPGAGPSGLVELDPDTQALAQRVFQTLKGLSKQYEPGYIDAFRLDFQTDWAHYVTEAQTQLQQALEAARHARERAATAAPR